MAAIATYSKYVCIYAYMLCLRGAYHFRKVSALATHATQYIKKLNQRSVVVVAEVVAFFCIYCIFCLHSIYRSTSAFKMFQLLHFVICRFRHSFTVAFCFCHIFASRLLFNTAKLIAEVKSTRLSLLLSYFHATLLALYAGVCKCHIHPRMHLATCQLRWTRISFTAWCCIFLGEIHIVTFAAILSLKSAEQWL